MRVDKKGVVLPYVMILGLSMLILATAMLSLVNISASRGKSSFEYAQAYSNARSAISFAQGVLLRDAQAGSLRSFYLSGTAGADNRMIFTGIYSEVPADAGTVYAVCTYTSTTGAVNITAYLKTPTYSKSRTIKYLTNFSQDNSLNLSSFTEIGSSFNTSSISQSRAKITSNVAVSASPVAVKTDLLVIGDTAPLDFRQNMYYSVTMTTLSGGSDVPVILQTALTVATLRNNGNVYRSFQLPPGHYHFTAGNQFSNSSAWVEQPDDGSEHYSSYGFTGGAFN